MLATTHVIIPLVIADLIRDYFLKHKHRRLIPRRYIFFVGVGGILPDIDIALAYLFNFLSIELPRLLRHGRITHSIFLVLALLIASAFLWSGTKFSKGPSKKEHHSWFLISILVAIGVLAHILLDGFAGDTTPYYPLSQAVAFGAQRINQQLMISIDAVILLAWLFHEEWHHNIKKFF
ncbi:metal-dependent hydrolase [Candidatus Woesearchaeota archaeon]|nr:metal-dependent hydrolase [Candidatus Woesearchaeota archaeon]